MRDKIGDEARLSHILEAVIEIQSYIEGVDFEAFSKNSMMLYATLKNLEIIGEASNHLSADLISDHPQIEWREIIGLRHILVHQYFEIQVRLIWSIITVDLPVFANEIEKIKASL